MSLILFIKINKITYFSYPLQAVPIKLQLQHKFYWIILKIDKFKQIRLFDLFLFLLKYSSPEF